MIQLVRALAIIAPVLFSLCVSPVQGGPYVPLGPTVLPANGKLAPSPARVPGKEFSHLPNKSAYPTHAATPGQSIFWDGSGGTANGSNYCPAGAACNVDALANHFDALFIEVALDQVPLVFSVADGTGRLFTEAPSIGGITLWANGAAASLPRHIDQSGVLEVGGVEVWGPELAADANRFSLVGDPAGCAVEKTFGGCLITSVALQAALGPNTLPQDLDALMVFEAETRILFSVVAGAGFDGGEIWDFNYGTGAIGFLYHGGHFWDTAFDVRGRFDLNSEDVNSLEAVGAVPEPGTFVLLGGALAAFALLRRRS